MSKEVLDISQTRNAIQANFRRFILKIIFILDACDIIFRCLVLELEGILSCLKIDITKLVFNIIFGKWVLKVVLIFEAGCVGQALHAYQIFLVKNVLYVCSVLKIINFLLLEDSLHIELMLGYLLWNIESLPF